MKVTMHRTIISPVFLYGCKTLSVAWEKERRLRVFENMVLRKIFEPKKKKVRGGYKKCGNEEFHNCFPHGIL